MGDPERQPRRGAQATAGSIPLLRDSVGRSGSSTAERGSIVAEGFALFLDGDTTGYGPARTKATLQNDQAPYVKEAHNDYLATLLERGVIGCVGLVLLIVAIALRCMALAGRHRCLRSSPRRCRGRGCWSRSPR